jgi:hypothetical protein
VSLRDASKWNVSTAKVLLSKGMESKVNKVQKLREALSDSRGSVISLFKKWDIDGDGRISRSEFIRGLPRLNMDLRFDAKDADELFSDLDRDGSGWINYKELDNELRREARRGQSPETLKLAATLLGRRDVVVVLGAQTKQKSALCARLAYTFGGSSISMRSLAEREAETPGSRVGGQLRRKLDSNQPLPTKLLMACLDGAVSGRSDDGVLKPLRGPFFLSDIPRSLLELRHLERRFGGARVVLFFDQRQFEETSHFSDPARDEIVSALKGRGDSPLLSLDAEATVLSLVEHVVRHLSVHGTRSQLAQQQQAKARDAERRRLEDSRREYLASATQFMTDALRAHGAQTARADLERRRAHVLSYKEPTGVVALRDKLRLARDAERERLGTQSGTRPRLPNASSTYGGRTSARLSEYSAVGSAGGGTERSWLTPRARFEPRIDLQLSPRNWREAKPSGHPTSIALPAVPGIYEMPAWDARFPSAARPTTSRW